MQPKIKQTTPFIVKTCSICGGTFGPEGFIKTKSLFYPDGYLPMCADCIKQLLIEHNFDWDLVDKLCRYADIPFIPAEFERLHESNGDNVFQVYADVFLSSEFEGLGWKQYYEEFLRLKEKGHIEDELPILKEEKRKQLKEKWGSNYDDEELQYLENLLDGLLQTQNISGALQFDQALKICKISLNLDSKIREGADFDKLMGSYDKLVKTFLQKRRLLWLKTNIPLSSVSANCCGTCCPKANARAARRLTLCITRHDWARKATPSVRSATMLWATKSLPNWKKAASNTAFRATTTRRGVSKSF